MYILIIWSALCTGIDPACETGDFLVFGEYTNKSECFKARKAWNASAEDHRAVCYWKDNE